MNNNEKNKIDINDLFGKLKNSGMPKSKNDVDSFVDANLNEEQANKVKELLGDEEKTKAILNSDAAKALFEKFFGGKGNG